MSPEEELDIIRKSELLSKLSPFLDVHQLVSVISVSVRFFSLRACWPLIPLIARLGSF